MLEAQEKETGPERAPRYPALSAISPILQVQQPPLPKEHNQFDQVFKHKSPWGTLDSNFHAFCYMW